MSFISLSDLRDNYKGGKKRFPEDSITYSIAKNKIKKMDRVNITIPNGIANQANLHKNNYADILYDKDSGTVKIKPITDNLSSGFRIHDIMKIVKGRKVAGNKIRIQIPFYVESGIPNPLKPIYIDKFEIKAGLIFQLPEVKNAKN